MNNQFYKLARYINQFPLGFLQQLSRQKAIFPFYHLVSDAEVLHVKHLYPVKSIRSFEKDLDFLLQHYKAIDLNNLERYIQTEKPIREKVFLLSFDDGLSQFYDIIAPILLRKGIPAINFLNSAFIDNKDLFFRYKQSLLVEKYLADYTPSASKKAVKNWFKNNGKAADIIPNSIKSIGYLQKDHLDELATILEVDFQDYLAKYQPYLSSDQIKSLINQGFEFGAHSIDHPHYFQLPLEQQVYQTVTSIQDVINKFQLDRNLFSFPFTDSGVSKAFFETIHKTDNPVADLSFGCAGMKKENFSKHIQRIPLENSNYSAREVITGEYLYYIAKMFFNRNTITRK